MIEEVDVSLQALSKTGRYYGRAELERKLLEFDGALFRDETGTYFLRTQQDSQGGNHIRIVLIFEVEGETASVVTQTSDHYDWSQFEQIQNPSFLPSKNS